MDEQHLRTEDLNAWDWEVRYVVSASKRGGALGRTYSLEKAEERVSEVLDALPERVVSVVGKVVLMGPMSFMEQDRKPVRTVATIKDRRIQWQFPMANAE